MSSSLCPEKFACVLTSGVTLQAHLTLPAPDAATFDERAALRMEGPNELMRRVEYDNDSDSDNDDEDVSRDQFVE